MSLITWSPTDKGTQVVLSNNNLTSAIPNHNHSVRATQGRSSDKWYWEYSFTSVSHVLVGISNKLAPINNPIYGNSNYRGYYSLDGGKYPNGLSYGQSYKVADIIGVALDLDNFTLSFYKNGVFLGISHTDLEILGEVFPTFAGGSSASVSGGGTTTANFGATPFAYSIPEGYKPYDYENADWLVKFKNLIFIDGKYHTYINNEFIKVEPIKENFELYGTDLLDIVTTPTDTVVVTMDEGNIVGEGREFKKSFNMIDFKNKYGEIKEINEV